MLPYETYVLNILHILFVYYDKKWIGFYGIKDRQVRNNSNRKG